MSDNTDTIYALYPAFRARDGFANLSADGLADVVQEVENLYKSFDGLVEVRGAYSTVGFRHDTDLLLWLVASAPEDAQAFLAEFRRTQAGRLTDIAWTFMGVVKPAEFTADHQPAFVKGAPPKTFLCVYPFVRTPEWYLLLREERGALLAEHGIVGREFPDVLANTTSAFGLGDWELSWRSRRTAPTCWWTASAACVTRRLACTRRKRSRSSPGSAKRGGRARRPGVALPSV